ncbi:hypothetical protein B0A53_03251 [Rhodotorula sp. CCFEE 5036]|nr:hypothetical protein B0A53_03251 [Rhodotorula sp. CCFEE 5036]
MRVSSNVLIAQAVLALQVAAAAVTQTSEVVAGSRTTLFHEHEHKHEHDEQHRLFDLFLVEQRDFDLVVEHLVLRQQLDYFLSGFFDLVHRIIHIHHAFLDLFFLFFGDSTSVSASSTAVGVPVQNNSSGGGLSGKTWGIIGGVVGGVAALLVGLFVIWRLAKRRSSNRAMDEIAWPELQNDATGGGFSVLNPPGTRQTGGAGFEMEKDREGGGGDYYDDDDEEGEIRNGGWAAAGGAVSPRLGYDPRSSAQYYGSEGGQYGYMPDYGGQPASRNYYDPYHHQEAPLPPLPPPSATLSGRSSPGLVVTSPTTTGGPLTSPQPGQNLPYPGSPIRSSEVVDSAYPPRSSRIYSSGVGAEDAYGGYAGMSTDDVPLTASAQYPAGAGAGIPYHPGASSPSPLYSPGR